MKWNTATPKQIENWEQQKNRRVELKCVEESKKKERKKAKEIKTEERNIDK